MTPSDDHSLSGDHRPQGNTNAVLGNSPLSGDPSLSDDILLRRKVGELLDRDKFQAAIHLLKKHLSEHSDDPVALILLAQTHNQQKNYLTAKQFAQSVIHRDPANLSAYDELVEALIGSDEHDEALRVINTAIVINRATFVRPEEQYIAFQFNGLLLKRWYLLCHLGLYTEALQQALEGLTLTPQNDWWHWDWQQNHKHSLIYLRRFDSVIDTQSPAAFLLTSWNTGRSLGYEKCFAEALPFFEQCLAFTAHPKTKDFRYLLALIECLHLAGEVQRSVLLSAFWEPLLSSPVKRRCLGTLRAVGWQAQGKRADAIEALRDLCGSMTSHAFLSSVQAELNFVETTYL